MSEDQVIWDCDDHVWKNSPVTSGTHKGKTVTQWVHALLSQKSIRKCSQCQRAMQKSLSYTDAPNIIAIRTQEKMIVESQIIWPDIDQMYRLCGIVYYTPTHFVCRVFDKSGDVWYHDGAENGEKVLYYGNIVNFPYKKLQTVDTKYVMKLVIYTRI